MYDETNKEKESLIEQVKVWRGQKRERERERETERALIFV